MEKFEALYSWVVMMYIVMRECQKVVKEIL